MNDGGVSPHATVASIVAVRPVGSDPPGTFHSFAHCLIRQTAIPAPICVNTGCTVERQTSHEPISGGIDNTFNPEQTMNVNPLSSNSITPSHESPPANTPGSVPPSGQDSLMTLMDGNSTANDPSTTGLTQQGVPPHHHHHHHHKPEGLQDAGGQQPPSAGQPTALPQS